MGSDDETKTPPPRVLVRGGGVPIQYPMLNNENYSMWAIKMKIIMRSLCVWEAVEGSSVVKTEMDHGAMAAIFQAVPDDVMMAIVDKESAKEAWDALKEMSVGEDRVKKARAQVLKRQFDRIVMDDSENILEFSRKLTTTVSEIRSLGVELRDSTVVEKLFGVVPDRFLPIIGTIEQWGDMSTMSVTDAIGRLRVFEESLKGRRHQREEEEEQLLLTRAQWEALSFKEKKDSEDSGSRRGYSQGDGHGNDKGKRSYRRFDKSKIRCFNCSEYGHFASECDQPKKEKAYVAEDEEDEPALLMLEAWELMGKEGETDATPQEWENTPEMGDYSNRNKKKRFESFVPVHDTLLEEARQQQMHVTVFNQKNRVFGGNKTTWAQTPIIDLAATISDVVPEFTVEGVDIKVKEGDLVLAKNNEHNNVSEGTDESEDGYKNQDLDLNTSSVSGSGSEFDTSLEEFQPTDGVCPSRQTRADGFELRKREVAGYVVEDEPKAAKLEEINGNVQYVSVVEENSHFHLGVDENDGKVWYLDTGASNHMTGCRKYFTTLNTSIGGTIKFGDGSTVSIGGRGTMLIKGSTSEHKALTDVYYIPKLTSNIISLGQLEERGCKVMLEGGYLRVFDRKGELEIQGIRTKNRLYVLNLNLVQLVCSMVAASSSCKAECIAAASAACQRLRNVKGDTSSLGK